MSSKKKQVLQNILTALIPYRDQSEGFLLLLNEEGNEGLTEKLYQEILLNIKNIKSDSQQKQIKTAIQKLKEKSEQATKTDEEEAEQMLEDLINNI